MRAFFIMKRMATKTMKIFAAAALVMATAMVGTANDQDRPQQQEAGAERIQWLSP